MHNVQWNLGNDCADYDFLGSNDVKDMAKVLEELMKSGAHELVYRCEVLFPVWYSALGLENMSETATEIFSARAG